MRKKIADKVNFQVSSRTIRLLCIVIRCAFCWRIFFSVGIIESAVATLIFAFFFIVVARALICDHWIITKFTYINLCQLVPASSRRNYFNATSNLLRSGWSQGFIQRNCKKNHFLCAKCSVISSPTARPIMD